jgi:hypothetical protein
VACERCGETVATYALGRSGSPSLRWALDRHRRELPAGPVSGRLVVWCQACGERTEVATAGVAEALGRALGTSPRTPERA